MRREPPSADIPYNALPTRVEDTWGTAEPLLNSETLEWEAIANLDDFFRRIYRYYEEKGLGVVVVARALDLAALGFTIAFSGLLLLGIDWAALRSECVARGTCDLSQVLFVARPLAAGSLGWRAGCLAYLGLFSAYWLYCLAHLVVEVAEAADIRHFARHRLGLSDRQLQTVSWPDVAKRIVQAQRTTRLCVARDLTEIDVVARIMRKENYLVGLLNRGALALTIPLPGLTKHLLLTKTLEWNLHWCLLDAMFDKNFRIKEGFVRDEANLQRRFRVMAVANLLLAPFLLAFLLIFCFMRNAERLYHQPGSAGARRWSPLAAWRLRELNELPHYLHHRLNASHRAAEKYLAQFPSPTLGHCAKFVAYVVGSFAAAVLALALYDDQLLERPLFGRNLVWWGATLGIVLTVSRTFIVEHGTAFEPEAALLEVTAHTHWLPRHWRGRAHTREVQTQFQQLFQYKAVLFAEELASVALTPFVLWFSLPQSAPAVLAFVRDFTTHVEGVGDVCSLATFDFQRHGNPKYGSPTQAPKAGRSRQGKMEKSFLSFAANYPTWEPEPAAKQFLLGLNGGLQGDLPARGPSPGLRGAPDGHAARMAAYAAAAFPYGGMPFPGFFPSLAGVSPYTVARGRGGGGSSQGDPAGAHLFASADFTASAMRASLNLRAPLPTLGEAQLRVASGQLALQSFYEERESALRRGGLHHSPEATLLGRSPLGPAPPTLPSHKQGQGHNRNGFLEGLPPAGSTPREGAQDWGRGPEAGPGHSPEAVALADLRLGPQGQSHSHLDTGQPQPQPQQHTLFMGGLGQAPADWLGSGGSRPEAQGDGSRGGQAAVAGWRGQRSWAQARGPSALAHLPLGGLEPREPLASESPPASELAFVVHSPKAGEP